ncbi:MAG: FtsW/RodA/SpoVE family cell cycle protein [Ruminococcaceae bacterium]|nr:FtsW/RodA/SpoVE family cell cycle protein [Oscillospiraceae bacterium]
MAKKKEDKALKLRKPHKRHPLKTIPMLLLITAYQLYLFSQLTVTNIKELEINYTMLIYFGVFIGAEWLYVIVMRAFAKRRNFEIELIGFFLTGIGFAAIGSAKPDGLLVQTGAFVLGLVGFSVLVWILGDNERAMKLRLPLGILAIVVLVANIFLGSDINGARNWIVIGNAISIQPSEFVKIIFVFVGAATLEKLQTSKNLYMFIGFSAACVGVLFILKDFGTAVIFFMTFLLIAFMRSGDVRTIALALASAGLGGTLIAMFKTTVKNRLATYRHVWEPEMIDGKGFQQTRVLIGIASGGLFGLGLGKGNVRDVIFSSTDLIFGVVCEELGFVTGMAILACFILFAVYAIRNARTSRSTFYSIAASAAAGLLLFQASINIFGVTDVIPFTGVTLPFISRGGSSMISCWALLAFIKAGDSRTYLTTYGEIKKK